MEATINGITLHYEDRGQGLPVLLIHAFPLNSAMWQPQLDALAEEFRLIVPDLRGFGGSTVPPGPYLMEQFADDMVALLDHLGLEQVVVGGVSMGGYVTFAFWRKYAARVRALVLSNTRAVPDTEEARTGRENNAQLAEREGVGIIAESMLPKLLSPGASADLRERLYAIVGRNQPAGIAGALRGMALRPDSTELLPQIKIPTLVLVGAQDGISIPAEMHTIHQHIPGSWFTEISDAGHLANVENPTHYNEALRNFLQHL